MKHNHASQTVYRVAMMQAAHQILDHPKIFKNPIALKIVGTQGESEIHSEKQKYQKRLHRYLRAIVVARSRFVEGELSEAIKRGIRQYVILGTGLDTFAYRNAYSSIGLKIFEIDYPATQEWKLHQLQAAGIALPDNLSFIPVDFENQVLITELRKAGFRTDEPSFFSWFGVTMDLNSETVRKTIQPILSMTTPGSQIVFDYVVPPSTQKFLRRMVFRLLVRRLERIGEP